ncbi:MAG: TrmH family RNA methyltransferase [Clostridia bacterium]|nr:TrmH family RNA methyltransferase [Clostridia bacterium]
MEKVYKKEENISYAFGAFPTMELLTHKAEYVTKILIHEKLEISQDIEKILDLAKSHKIVIEKNGKLIEKLSKKGNVYIVGVFKKYDMKIDNNASQVVLVNPSDMGNLGTIIRVMTGFGIKNLAVITPCVDYFDPRVVRASMGSVFQMNIEAFSSFEEYEKVNSNPKYPFMLQASTSLSKLNDIPKTYSLVFGNEATGLMDSFLEKGTPLIIKHTHDIDSLNLSMSVGIALFHFTKGNF